MAAEERNLDFLTEIVRKIWKVIYEAGQLVRKDFPPLATDQYPDFPKELEFIHAEELLERYPDLPRKERETRLLQEFPGVFIYGIGYVLEDGYPHEMRAADYDDWITPTIQKNGKTMHGLNGDILVWNPVTKRRHELTSMGIRVTKETLVQQLKETGQESFLEMPYHQMVMNDQIPLSIGGGIGQARTFMYLLRTAHLGEVIISVWPKQLKEICAAHNIHVLE
jgi:aspartate--ammonia ligase